MKRKEVPGSVIEAQYGQNRRVRGVNPFEGERHEGLKTIATLR